MIRSKRARMRSHAGGDRQAHGRHDISLESIVQHSAGADAQKTVILVTPETTEAAVRKAVEGIKKDGHLTDKPQVIRIERAE